MKEITSSSCVRTLLVLVAAQRLGLLTVTMDRRERISAPCGRNRMHDSMKTGTLASSDSEDLYTRRLKLGIDDMSRVSIMI